MAFNSYQKTITPAYERVFLRVKFMSYDSRIDNAVRDLQRAIKASDDGAWGNASQKVLKASGKKIDFNWQKLRDHFGSFNQAQVDGFNSLLTAINNHDGDANNPLYTAYIMATTWHETDQKMQSISEYGKGASRRYGKWYKNSKGVVYGHANHKRLPYLKSQYPYLYYGRGYPQLTWLDNYIKMGKIIGVDLANNPELALLPDNSARIMIEGMLRGSFTGLSLVSCIRYGSYGEFVYSRRIINGVDRDSLIARYAVQFLECIKLVEA